MAFEFARKSKIEPWLKAEEFELIVKRFIDVASVDLSNYRSTHRASVAGEGGVYEIDILVSFVALGVSYTTLIECKSWKRAIERAVIHELSSKLSSCGANKGIVFSTSGFQEGAVVLAQSRGISLAHVIATSSITSVSYVVPATNIRADVHEIQVPCEDNGVKFGSCRFGSLTLFDAYDR